MWGAKRKLLPGNDVSNAELILARGIQLRLIQMKNRPRGETEIYCRAPRGQRSAPSLKCTARITWSSARLKNEDHLVPKYGVNHFGMWCRRRESNDTPLLIIRNLLKTYERKNRTTRCMPASYVQNHVQQFEGRVRRGPLNAGLR